ncbi:MAG: T9SS type A sorting domain-containing protein [Bacteroidales bacterium]|nr:T9SS type A sorting domain-containing protein [Bacteroidales bacterium]
MKTIIIAVLSLIVQNVFSQITFEKTFGDIDDDYGSAIAVCFDGTYIFTGTVENIYTGDPDIFLAKLDPFGDTLWTRKYINEYHYDYPHDIIQSYDSGYVITGVTYLEDNKVPFILKYDAGGEISWFKKYEDEIPDGYGYAIVQKPDSGFMICGERDFYKLRWYYRPYMLQTNGDGNCTWHQVFEYFGEFAQYSAYSMCMSPENGYVLCGTHRNNLESNIDQAWMFKVSDHNTVSWNIKYGYSDSTTSAADVKLIPGGGYVFCGSIYYGSIIFPNWDINFYLVRTDLNGTEIWRKNIGHGDHEERGRSLDVCEDGGYIIGGESDMGQGHDDILLVKTNDAGDTLWTKSYGGVLNEELADICVAPDGGFLICGSTYSQGIGGSDIYIIKTDPNGVLTGINEKSAKRTGPVIVPNPGNGAGRLQSCYEYESYEIFDINGRLVRESKCITGDKETIDLGHLSRGVYLIRFKSSTTSTSVKYIKSY